MNITFAQFDMDIGYVYAKESNGNIILIDCTVYEQTYDSCRKLKIWQLDYGMAKFIYQ